MSKRQNTNNPIPSNELADLNDNTIIIDEFTNSKEDYTQDRFGNKFKTREKILTDLQKAVDDISSGAGFLPITGGTVTGSVKIEETLEVKENLTVEKDLISNGESVHNKILVKNDENSDLVLETKSGNNEGYTIRKSNHDLFIYSSKNSVTADNYIAKYYKEIDTWDFNTAGLTKKNVPVVDLNQFENKLESPSGYQKLPSGLMMQWHFFEHGYAGRTYDFPVAFPHACLTMLLTDGGAANGIGYIANQLTRTSFMLWCTQPNFSVSYIAIGY